MVATDIATTKTWLKWILGGNIAIIRNYKK